MLKPVRPGPPSRRSTFLREVWHRLVRQDVLFLAGAVAFYFLLALVPLLLLGTSLAAYLLGPTSPAADRILEATRMIFPRATGNDIEGALRALQVHRGVAGGLGLLSLLWVASGVFDAVSSALAQLLGWIETRSFLRRKLLGLATVLASGFLFLLAVPLGAILTAVQAFGETLLGRLGDFPLRQALPVAQYLPALLVGATFGLLYRFAPPRPMRLRTCLLGGALGGLLWHAAKRTFNWYLLNVARYNVVYGLVGSFIALLLWIYYTAVILLVVGLLVEAAGRPGS
jgi:membrane protein